MTNYGQLNSGASPSGAAGQNGHTSNGHRNAHLDTRHPSLPASTSAGKDSEKSGGSCCGLSSQFIVYVLFIFNFIFFTSGAVMLILTILYRSGLIEGFGEDLQLAAIRAVLPFSHPLNMVHYAMIVCSLLICLISVIMLMTGCCVKKRTQDAETVRAKRISQEETFDMEIASDEEDDDDEELSGLSMTEVSHNGHKRVSIVDAKKEKSPAMSSAFLCFFIFALLLLFTVQLSIAMIGFVSVSTIVERQQLEDAVDIGAPPIASSLLAAIRDNYNASFTNGQVLEAGRGAFDRLEAKFKCCGLVDYNDYVRSKPVPESCCKTRNAPDCGVRRHPSNIYYDGCVPKLEETIKEQLTLLAALASGLSAVEVFGLVFSCCLYVRLLAMDKDREARV